MHTLTSHASSLAHRAPHHPFARRTNTHRVIYHLSHAHTHTNTHTLMQTHTQTHTHSHKHTYTHTHKYVTTHTHTHANTHTNTHTLTQTHIHTHTQIRHLSHSNTHTHNTHTHLSFLMELYCTCGAFLHICPAIHFRRPTLLPRPTLWSTYTFQPENLTAYAHISRRCVQGVRRSHVCN